MYCQGGFRQLNNKYPFIIIFYHFTKYPFYRYLPLYLHNTGIYNNNPHIISNTSKIPTCVIC